MDADGQALVGRGDLVALVAALVTGAARVVVLEGLGGIGKTAVARAVADATADSFDDAPVLVPVPAGDVELVGDAVARAVGARQTGGGRPWDRVAAVVGPRRLLLVVDGLERAGRDVGSVLDALDVLADSCPGLRVLVTSRAPAVRPHLPRVPVPPLDPDAAVAVLRAAAVRAGARPIAEIGDEASLHQLAAAVDHNPLALTLLGARLRALPADALQAILRAGPGDLHEVVLEQLGLASAPARDVLARLAVWRGPVPGAIVSDAAGATDVIALPLVAELVELGLLDRRPGGYVVPAAVAATVMAGLDDATRARLRSERLAVLRTVAGGASGPAELLAIAEPLAAELGPALVDAITDGQGADALALAAALGPWFLISGRLEEGRRVLDAAVDAAPPGTPAPLLASALAPAGTLAYFAADYPGARDRHERCRALGAGTPLAVVGTVGVGLALSAQGHYEEALAELAAALDAAEWAPPPVAAHARFAYALLCHLSGDAKAAVEPAQAALDLAERLGDVRLAANCRYGMALIALDTGELRAAELHLDAAVDGYRRVGDRRQLTMCWHARGLVAVARGRLADAVAHHAEAVAIGAEVGDRWNLTLCLEALGEIAVAAGDAERAARAFGAAAAMREAIGAPTPAYRREAVSRAEEAAARALGEAVYHAAWLSGRGADPASLLPTVPTPAAVAAGGALSPRELEVLRIIAAGDTDAEAAEQLYVSVRTVHGHLQAIYRKLGVRTRTAAAAWAHDQGL